MYRSILPLVQSQVSSQIKVRDFSGAKVSIQPSDTASWSDVRTDLIAEAKSALRSELEAEIAGAANPDEIEALRLAFNKRERSIETSVDSRVHTFSAILDVSYKYVSHTNSNSLHHALHTSAHVANQLALWLPPAASSRNRLRTSRISSSPPKPRPKLETCCPRLSSARAHGCSSSAPSGGRSVVLH
jgi:hypothetical protein